MGAEHFDVVVVGAGISGIAAAHHLQTRCPNLSFLVLERRASFGGTWDLFKYPGIRSDSDMFTMGFEHRPWGSPKLIAPKEDILAYLKKTIDEGGLAKHIRFHKNIVTADWSSSQARWSLQCQDGSNFTCNFLYGCTGYFEHDKPFEPEFPGAERFRANGGILVHPQKWPEDLDYTGKRVAVIGSGATAITLVPSMADKAKHVTMVQRSPTWILPVPNYDITAGSALEDGVGLEEMHRRVRERRAEEMSNGDFAGPPLGKDVSLEERSQTYLKWVRDLVPHLSDAEFQKHFVPKYKLWEQRLCASPDGDFFVPLREGKASIVTDHIKTFDETGILMESGEHVDCDIVAAATGLNLHSNAPMADIQVNVDGKPYVASEHRIFRDCMLSDVPNFMFCIGYFNISWTMKVDLVGKHLCRILTHMKETGSSMVCPRLPAGGLGEPPALEVSSSYWVRNWHLRPKHGKTGSWQPLVTYEADRHTLLEAPITDECLHFSSEMSSGDLTHCFYGPSISPVGAGFCWLWEETAPLPCQTQACDLHISQTCIFRPFLPEQTSLAGRVIKPSLMLKCSSSLLLFTSLAPALALVRRLTSGLQWLRIQQEPPPFDSAFLPRMSESKPWLTVGHYSEVSRRSSHC